DLASKIVLENKFSEEGDMIIITAGVPVGERGTTNVMKIQLLGSKILTGQGIGNGVVIGKAVLAETAAQALERVQDDSILVVKATDKDYTLAIQQASGVIVEQGGLTSHAAVLGI